MKITVFTPNHNNAKYISKSIESVLNQTYTNFEYLIYDDGSTDSSVEMISKYADDRIKMFSLEKQDNVGVVINKSFEESTGDYWCWCPSDDYFYPNMLQSKIDATKKYPESIIYNDWDIINENGIKTSTHRVSKMSSEYFSEEVWRTSPIGFTGIFIPKEIYKNLPFPTHLKYSEDFYWMILATIHGYKFDGISQVLHCKRKHSNSLTNKNLKQILNNIPVIRQELLNIKNNKK